jgi:hypothetical protein
MNSKNPTPKSTKRLPKLSRTSSFAAAFPAPIEYKRLKYLKKYPEQKIKNFTELPAPLLSKLTSYLEFHECAQLACINKSIFQKIYENSENFKILDFSLINLKVPLSQYLKMVTSASDSLRILSIPEYFNRTDIVK